MPAFSLQYLLNFPIAIHGILGQLYPELWAYISPGFQAQYVLINLKAAYTHLAFWTAHFRVSFFYLSPHFYVAPFLEIKYLYSGCTWPPIPPQLYFSCYPLKPF